MHRLKNKVAIVTGSSNIVKPIALRFGDEGANVVVTARRNALCEHTVAQVAKQGGEALVYQKEVTLRTYGEDKYGRTLADVLIPYDTNVNHTLVKDGWCWWYRKYAPLNTELEQL